MKVQMPRNPGTRRGSQVPASVDSLALHTLPQNTLCSFQKIRDLPKLIWSTGCEVGKMPVGNDHHMAVDVWIPIQHHIAAFTPK
jgi:hypothetical protein